MRAEGTSATEKEKYERAFNSAVHSAYILVTRGTIPRPFFDRGLNETRARLDSGEFEGKTFEDVVAALYHEIVMAHLEDNNRQNDDTTSFLADSVRVSMWPSSGGMMQEDLDDALTDPSMVDLRWTSACSRYRRTSSPVPASGSS